MRTIFAPESNPIEQLKSLRLNSGKMDNSNGNPMDDTTMIRYLLGKYGLTDLVAMLRSAAASGEHCFLPHRLAELAKTDDSLRFCRTGRCDPSRDLGEQ